jgi:hypothetical protein
MYSVYHAVKVTGIYPNRNIQRLITIDEDTIYFTFL